MPMLESLCNSKLEELIFDEWLGDLMLSAHGCCCVVSTVCHRFRLTNLVAYFRADFDLF